MKHPVHLSSLEPIITSKSCDEHCVDISFEFRSSIAIIEEERKKPKVYTKLPSAYDPVSNLINDTKCFKATESSGPLNYLLFAILFTSLLLSILVNIYGSVDLLPLSSLPMVYIIAFCVCRCTYVQVLAP